MAIGPSFMSAWGRSPRPSLTPAGGQNYSQNQYRKRHLSGDPKLLQMRPPGRRIGKLLVRVFRQASDDGSGERTLAHVAQCHIIDHVIGISGAQQIEEVPAALAIGRAEPGKVFITDLGAKAVGGFMAPVSSTVIQLALRNPARNTSRASARNTSCPAISSRITCRFEMLTPIARSCSTSRGTVT